MAEEEKKAQEAPVAKPIEKKDEPKQPPKVPPAPQAPAVPEKEFEGFLAEVVSVEQRRTGIYGEIKQAMCKILEGRDKGRVIRRNFAGRIKKGDMIRLPDTSREDKRIMAR